MYFQKGWPGLWVLVTLLAAVGGHMDGNSSDGKPEISSVVLWDQHDYLRHSDKIQ